VSDGTALFFGFWPPASVASAIDQRRVSLDQGRPVALSDLHMTLAFLGPVAAPAAQRLGGLSTVACPGVRVRLTHRLVWSRARCVVLVPDDCPSGLHDAHSAMVARLSALGVAPKPTPFRPHVTVMRGVTGVQGEAPIEPVDWVLDELRLVASERTAAGSTYTPLASWRASLGADVFVRV
jgi:2'-5' RNA ligase